MTRQDGSEAPVYRALMKMRESGGLPKDLATVYWGAWSIPIMSLPMPAWVVPSWGWRLILAVVALMGHGLLAWKGRDNPYWYKQLWRKWSHGDVATVTAPKRRGNVL